MTSKKSIFSYFIWIMFAVYYCMALVQETANVMQASLTEDYTVLLLVCGAGLVLSLFYAVFRIAARRIYAGMQGRERLICVCRILLPMLILLICLVRFAMLISDNTPLLLSDDTYYTQAFVQPGSSASGGFFSFSNGVSGFYISLLHLVFLLFGNNPFAGIALQLVLCFIAIILLYICAEKLWGLWAGMTAMAAFGLLPGTLTGTISLTPGLLFVVLYLLGLFWFSTIVTKRREDDYEDALQTLMVLFYGIYVGFLGSLDLFGLTLLLLCGGLYFLRDTEDGKRIGLFAILFAVLGTLIGFVIGTVGLFCMQELSFADFLSSQMQAYFGNVSFSFSFVSPDYTVAGTAVLLGLGFFVIPGFLIRGQNSVTHILFPYLLLVLTTMFHCNAMDMQPVHMVFLCMIAGLGADALLGSGIEEPMAEVVYAWEEDDFDYDYDDEEAPSEEALPEASPSTPESGSEGLPSTADSSEEALPAGQESAADTAPSDAPSTGSQPLPGAPLSNPLPLPKQHKRKAIDFSYEIPEEKMCFDLDDFDEIEFDH